ncbi:MAG: Ig-like domain-containing protein [Clostridia bacterium]|nr:Ig-like domain-containing protein [Clostridia bacterium]
MKRLIAALVACLCFALLPALAEGMPEAPVGELELMLDAEEAAVEGMDAALAQADDGFPDDAFRAYVMANFDANRDGAISAAEAKKVKTVDVTGLGIESLAGLERFTKVTALYCGDNRLAALDVSALKSLKTLVCARNALTALDLSANKSLATLNCAHNGLTALDLTANKSLNALLCDHNPLPAVELGKCSKLMKLVKGTFPGVADGAIVYERKSGKVMETAISLPDDAVIALNGATWFDPASELALTTEEIRLTEKQKLTLLAPECGYPAAYCAFATTDKKVAAVTAAGVVTAAKAGEATVTVTTFDGATASCRLTVVKAPTKVTLSQKKLSLGQGQGFDLVADVPAGCYAEYTWSSNKESVATVSDGRVTAVGPGKATITVKTQNNKKATCAVTVLPAPTFLTLSAEKLGLLTGQVVTLKAAIDKGAAGEVAFSADDPAVADIDPATGVVTAVGLGETTLRATTYNGLTAACAVEVMPGPATVAMLADATLCVGDALALDAVALTADGWDVSQVLAYTSDKPKVASVSADGRVEALKAGTATVTAAAANGVKATCKVVVGKAPTSVKLDKKTLKLNYDAEKGAGDSYTFKVTLSSGAVTRLTFDTSDEAVARVDEKGTVTAVGVGAAAVTVATANGKTASCAVTVADPAAAPTPAPKDSRAASLAAAKQTDQIVLVEYKSGSSATLSVHEKLNGVWTQLLETDAYVGKKGIDKTKEGDKKTPTGTYNLTTPFGIKADPGAKLDYVEVTKYHYWCGTSKSEYYNQLVDSRETGRSYTSSDEHLIDYAPNYNYCMFIDYNAEGVSGKGSCIFLHCKGSNSYTAGCVAVDEWAMKEIIRWAGDNVKIVIKKA